MTAPIAGPFVTDNGESLPTYHHYRSSWRQKKPFNLVLPFDEKRGFVEIVQGEGLVWKSAYQYANEAHSYTNDFASNAAYSKFLGKMRAQNASLGVTLGEQQSARAMMTARSKQLYGFMSSVVRRDFKTAYRIARTDFPRKGVRSHIKSGSGLILEYSWGWAPMISDIGEALKTLIDPVTPIYARSSHTISDNVVDPVLEFSGWTPGIGAWRQTWKHKYSVEHRVSTGARIDVENPNTVLANRLGVLNIPQVIWQVQPFSFIVDKYVNVGQMIGSLSDVYGFTLADEWTARRTVIKAVAEFVEVHNDSVVNYTLNNCTALGKSRQSGLLAPSLALRKPSIGSFGEAVSYMALLTQLLLKTK